MIFSDLLEIIKNKKVLFITLSDVDYIRNRQEIDLIQSAALKLDIIAPKEGGGINPTGIVRIASIILRVIASDISRYDIIFVGGIPQFIIPFIQSRLKFKILILDFFISVYDTIVCDRHLVSEANPLALILKKCDKNALAVADHVIVDTRAHGSFFSRAFDVIEDKMTVLYLEADKRIYYPRKAKRPGELMGKFVVFFFGAMNPLQGVEIILEAARVLEEHSNVVFVIIGPCGKIKDFGRYSKLENVRFGAQWLSQPEIADCIAVSDVCLAGHFNSMVEKASRVIPGKAFSYLAMDRPVIFGDNPANRELFSEADKNVCFVRMGDPVALADRILELAAGAGKRLLNGR